MPQALNVRGRLFFKVRAEDRDGNTLRELNVRATSRDRAIEAARRLTRGAISFRVWPLRDAAVYVEA